MAEDEAESSLFVTGQKKKKKKRSLKVRRDETSHTKQALQLRAVDNPGTPPGREEPGRAAIQDASANDP